MATDPASGFSESACDIGVRAVSGLSGFSGIAGAGEHACLRCRSGVRRSNWSTGPIRPLRGPPLTPSRRSLRDPQDEG